MVSYSLQIGCKTMRYIIIDISSRSRLSDTAVTTFPIYLMKAFLTSSGSSSKLDCISGSLFRGEAALERGQRSVKVSIFHQSTQNNMWCYPRKNVPPSLHCPVCYGQWAGIGFPVNSRWRWTSNATFRFPLGGLEHQGWTQSPHHCNLSWEWASMIQIYEMRKNNHTLGGK